MLAWLDFAVEKKNEVEDLKKQNNDLQTELKTVQTDIKNERQEITDLTSKIEVKSAENEQLKQQNNTLQTALQTAQHTAQAQEEQKKADLAALAALSEKNSRLTSEIEVKNKQIIELTEENNTLKDKIKSLLKEAKAGFMSFIERFSLKNNEMSLQDRFDLEQEPLETVADKAFEVVSETIETLEFDRTDRTEQAEQAEQAEPEQKQSQNYTIPK